MSSEQQDEIVTWLDALNMKRPDISTGLTYDLLREVGYPPLPPKGTSFGSIEAHSRATTRGSLWAARYAENALDDRASAQARGDLVVAEQAAARAQFYSHVSAWFEQGCN
jgi:hypothetical protein